MPKNILILHGWGGSDAPHWQAWLAKELHHLGYQVHFPELHDRELPLLQDWLAILHHHITTNPPEILITHSLGNMLFLHYQERYGVIALEKLLLVAPVSQKCKLAELQEFFPYPTPTHNAQKSLLIGSTNDPYISKEETHQLGSILSCQVKILEDAQHINADSNYGAWPFALSWVIEA